MRLTKTAIAAGRRRRASGCVVKIPDDIRDLVAIRTAQGEIAKLVRQATARPENPGLARALSRELFKMQQAFQRRHGFWPPNAPC